MSAGNYIIRKAISDNDHSALVNFLQQHFFHRVEIQERYFSEKEHIIDEAEKKIIAEDMKNRFTAMVLKNLCYIAVQNASTKIVGMSLISVKRNPKFYMSTDNSNESNDSTYKGSFVMRSKIYADYINDVLKPLFEATNGFAQFPSIPVALELTLLCVDPNYCRQGLATKLTRETIRYAESNNISLVYGLFTSPFSRKAAEKNGFQTYSDVDILSLLDGEGNVIFKRTGSLIASGMAKRLQ